MVLKIKPIISPKKPLETVSKTDETVCETDETAIIQNPAKSNIEFYSCSVCSQKCSSYSRLVFHLANHHFRDKLDEFVEGVDCSICKKSFGKKSKVLFHLAWNHKALGDLIPKKKHIVTKKMVLKIKPIMSPKKPLETVSETDETVSETDETVCEADETVCEAEADETVCDADETVCETDESDENSEKPLGSKILACHLCSRQFPRYNVFLQHFCKVHFSNDLLKRFQKQKLQVSIFLNLVFQDVVSCILIILK